MPWERHDMDKTQPPIDVLRQRLQLAKSGTLGDEMLAVVNLLEHPDLRWNDVLDALKCRPGVNAEAPALFLHSFLKIPLGKPPRVNCDRQFWEETLRGAGFGQSDRVGSRRSISGKGDIVAR